MLKEDLAESLHGEAESRRVSMSEDVQAAVERIRQLRRFVGPVPDSTPVIRESRDRGW